MIVAPHHVLRFSLKLKSLDFEGAYHGSIDMFEAITPRAANVPAMVATHATHCLHRTM